MNKIILCVIDIINLFDKDVFEIVDKLVCLDGVQLDVIMVVFNFGVILVSFYFDEYFQDQMVQDIQEKLVVFVSEVFGDDWNKDLCYVVVIGLIYEEILELVKIIEVDLIVIGVYKLDLCEFLFGLNVVWVVWYLICFVYVVCD